MRVGVGRPARGKRNGAQRGHLVLVRAIVIHHPDFLVAGFVAHIGDLCLRDAGQAAAQHADDVVGKLVGQLACIPVFRVAPINFLQRQGRGGIVHIGEKSRDRQAGAVDRHVAVGHHVSVRRSSRPVRRFHFARLAGNLRGIEAGADHVQHARIFQVGPQHIMKRFFQRLRRRRANTEIGCR